MRGRLLYLCVGDGSDSGADANAPVCAAGATTPEPDPGVGGREEWSGSARRANRREFVDWCNVWR